MQIAETDFLILSQKQATLFLEDQVTYSEMLVKNSALRSILLMGYNRLTISGKIKTLEELPREQQMEAGEMAKEIAKGRLKRRELIDLVKSLFVIEFFLNV